MLFDICILFWMVNLGVYIVMIWLRIGGEFLGIILVVVRVLINLVLGFYLDIIIVNNIGFR